MIKKIIGNCVIYNGKCEEVMEILESNSINAVITDPPYLYLKHRLDIPFDENKVFTEWKRLLKNNSLIAFFGRGDAFFRWNIELNKLGFIFKETAVWEKENASNFLNNFLRIHEDIAFRAKGNCSLNKCYIDYLEYVINKNSLNKIKDIFSSLKGAINGKDKEDVIKYIELGIQEFKEERKVKHKITAGEILQSSQALNIFNTVKKGKVETSILRCNREQYKYEHPTQKPINLMERIINLTTNENDTVLDCFMGSGSTGIACINTNRKFIGIELASDYFDIAKRRIENAYREKQFNNNIISNRTVNKQSIKNNTIKMA
ncbi:site-specific DNA-methyltransferase [uncultured Brachyspira sp.]|uniref:DNA-methyltransferase n=1 Tax=uncultured Brachyspira sp. TaxID=221953 RepID=UPI00258D57B1|nr:site-specific DNA-methyltransferase [uncultured Brachyspira sp.]